MSFTDAELTATLPTLRRVAKRLTRDENAVDDLVSDTVVKALQFKDRFQEGGNLPGWMTFIMRNHFVSGTRRNKFKGEAYDGAELNIQAIDNPEATIDLGRVMEAVGQLPHRQMQSILLVAQGNSYDEIAYQMKLPVGTVKSAVFRGRAVLNKRFQ